MNATVFISFWHKWKGKAGLSVADQCVFSGANFIFNILLIRWLSPLEYGIFAIAFSFFLFISGFHTALILEPLSVIGSAHYNNKKSSYLGVIVWIHGMLSAIFSVVLILIAFILALRNNSLSSSFLGLSLAVPLILFFWFFRQSCYLQTSPGLALKASLVYTILLFSIPVIFYRQSWLSSFSALFIMGLASIGASLVFWHNLGVSLSNLSWGHVKFIIRNILIDHWRYGKWVVGSAFVNWLAFLVYLPLIGFFLGLAPAGGFRAMQNMLLPLEKVLTSFTLLLLPWMSRQHAIYGKDYLKRNLFKFIVMSILLAVIYIFLLLLFGKTIIKFLYKDGYYGAFVWLLPWIAITTLINSISYGLAIGLRVLEHSDSIFWAQLFGAIFTFSVGLYLIMRMKLLGAALGSLFSIFLATAIILYFLKKNLA